MIEDRIAKVLQERFEEDDLKSCFLVGVERQPNDKLIIYIDSDDRLTIDMCRKTSRCLENAIEENGWMPEKYTIDVSSPGIDNPLKLHRQYVKNIGRNATFKLNNGESKEGKIISVEEDSIVISVVSKKKEVSETIPMNEINETKILISFK